MEHQIRCYSCDEILSVNNSSKEHIIHNFLGGRISSSTLLCVTCNSRYGESIDKELEEQVGMLTQHLGINRQRNNNINVKLPLVSKEGEVRYVDKKLKPLNKLTYEIDGKKIVIHENDANYQKTKNKKQKDLEKKHKVSYFEYIKPPDGTKYHIQNKLSNASGDIMFGGRDFFRALAKICVNFYISLGYDKKHCKEPITFIKGEEEYNNLAFFYYSTTTQIHELKEEEVSHIIHISGDPKAKILYAYIELFNTENAIIVFDRDYDGPLINESYVYDLLKNIRLDKEIRVPLRKHHFEVLRQIEEDSAHIHLARFNRLEKIIEKRQLL